MTGRQGALAVLILCMAASGLCAQENNSRAARLPAPGTYLLQRIQRTPQASLLDAEGRAAQLSASTRGAVTALGFFYGHCADPAGCPVAWSTFETARREADADALLKSKLRLVFVSLDPEHDTPNVLRLLRSGEATSESAIPWEFLTSRSYDELAPLLREMGQDISFATDSTGHRTGVINHMLKVFLIDPDGWVREIYTTAFLTPESLLNDARTLAMAHPEASNERRGP
jgi:cytochrome oxidase Cu insertion factor (SCO1/SenC/PrrC family)